MNGDNFGSGFGAGVACTGVVLLLAAVLWSKTAYEPQHGVMRVPAPGTRLYVRKMHDEANTVYLCEPTTLTVEL